MTASTNPLSSFEELLLQNEAVFQSFFFFKYTELTLYLLVRDAVNTNQKTSNYQGNLGNRAFKISGKKTAEGIT